MQLVTNSCLVQRCCNTSVTVIYICANKKFSGTTCFQGNRPDMTFTVDWALKPIYLSIYISIYQSIHPSNQNQIQSYPTPTQPNPIQSNLSSTIYSTCEYLNEPDIRAGNSVNMSTTFSYDWWENCRTACTSCFMVSVKQVKMARAALCLAALVVTSLAAQVMAGCGSGTCRRGDLSSETNYYFTSCLCLPLPVRNIE